VGRKRGTQYRPGSFWRQDDRSGFSVRAEETKQEWNNLIVDKKLWEIRQPQDFVKGIVDDQNVPEPRPLPPTTYDGPIYTQLSSPMAIGDSFIPLQFTTGFSAGDAIGIMTDFDNGTYFNATVQSVTSGGIYIYTETPYPASSGNLVVDYRFPGEVPNITDRITESGAIRITEDGDTRILE
jgi:hypothetical protein